MPRYYDLPEYTERRKLQQELRANVEKDILGYEATQKQWRNWTESVDMLTSSKYRTSPEFEAMVKSMKAFDAYNNAVYRSDKHKEDELVTTEQYVHTRGHLLEMEQSTSAMELNRKMKEEALKLQKSQENHSKGPEKGAVPVV